MNKPKIAFVVAVPLTAKAFLLEHFKRLSDFYEITLIANFRNDNDYCAADFNVDKIINLKIERKINIFSDLTALIRLFIVFKNNSFNVVHSVTPKAGLVTMLASKFAGVTHRIHTFTGQVWATKTGVVRFGLKMLDKLIHHCTTLSLVDSFSQRDFLVSEKVLTSLKSQVLGQGSISGVKINRFTYNEKYRQNIRKQFQVNDSEFIILFLGRLCTDKGIDELLCAFKTLLQQYQHICLMLVGPNEEKYDAAFFKEYDCNNIILTGATDKPEMFFSASDLFVMPSYREGLGTVILEAAAAGLPSVGSNIYGLSDAIVDGETGLLFDVCNAQDLAVKIRYFLDHKAKVKTMGDAARLRVEKYFSSNDSSQALLQFYQSLC